jgi:hypothetical protein
LWESEAMDRGGGRNLDHKNLKEDEWKGSYKQLLKTSRFPGLSSRSSLSSLIRLPGSG